MTAGPTYVPIATQTIVGSSTQTVTFSSIPQTYTDLVLTAYGQTVASGGSNLQIYLNGDTGNNYSRTYMIANGSTFRGGWDATLSCVIPGELAYGSSSLSIVHFMNYSNATNYKTILSKCDNVNSFTAHFVCNWRNTAAINSINAGVYTGTFMTAGTVITLYGIASA